mmetsp:Transcript_9214/g.33782  ORF Transcript_9214/g.33782 Transcript_9214/m.33782 type:complete len:242 (+) Transcript_9214:147-872(+)
MRSSSNLRAHTSGASTSTTSAFFRYTAPLHSFLSTTRTRMLGASHGRCRVPSPSLLSSLSLARPSRCMASASTLLSARYLIFTRTASSLGSSATRTLVALGAGSSSTLQASPAWEPPPRYMRLSRRGPRAVLGTKSSPTLRVCRTLPSSPGAATICTAASRLSPGLRMRVASSLPPFFLFLSSRAFSASAPRPSSAGRGTYSMACTCAASLLLCARPTFKPSRQPIPRNMASPKLSMGICS